MDSAHVDIVGIIWSVDDQGQRYFNTLLNGPTLTLTHPTSAQSLLDYQTFQRELLLGLGFLYRLESAEYLDPIGTNAAWRHFVQDMLLKSSMERAKAEQDTKREGQSPPPEAGGTMMN